MNAFVISLVATREEEKLFGSFCACAVIVILGYIFCKRVYFNQSFERCHVSYHRFDKNPDSKKLMQMSRISDDGTVQLWCMKGEHVQSV